MLMPFVIRKEEVPTTIMTRLDKENKTMKWLNIIVPTAEMLSYVLANTILLKNPDLPVPDWALWFVVISKFAVVCF